ncbi:ATP synthase F0 subunit B [Mesoterricola sediminis]|uniref:ATP synthase subunit b n=1 Tax=Mesoterricola sediminis TaxID=2927980 RepID=A0AA48KB35_9BACT|nr:ATP synthase F0 subunit B [Mesoterricola sediminis]BDU75366.1 hypothetical protein METESE_03240 [Mesoterricola sediminis]
MRILRLLTPLAVTAALALGAPALRAQEHGQAPVHETQPTEAAPAHEAGHGETPAAQGEGHAAAGHDAGHGGAHHTPLKLFGMELERGGQFLVQLFNFALFAGILFFLLKGALSSAFKARARELEDKLGQAERERAEADAQIQELEARMAGLQAELEGIMAKAGAEAEAEKARIIQSAQAEAAQIRAQTKAEIDFQKRAAEAELRTLVAELAVEGASRRLQERVKGEVAAQVLDRSIQQVGGAQ